MAARQGWILVEDTTDSLFTAILPLELICAEIKRFLALL
jgi:hypothetical protein